MPFWVDTGSYVGNLVQVTSDAIVIGSCNEKQLAEIESKLALGGHLVELLGCDQVEAIPLSKIVWLQSRSTNHHLDIETASNSLTTTHHKLSFENPNKAKQAALAIGKALPEGFRRKSKQTNEITASLAAWASFSVAWILSRAHFNTAPWIVGVVGGVWILLSLVMIGVRIANPPLVISWQANGHKPSSWIRKAKGIPCWIVLLLILLIGLSGYPNFSRSDRLLNYVANSGSDRHEIARLVADGAELNIVDDAGYSALDWAIEFDQHNVAIVLLDMGADFQHRNAEGYTAVDLAFSDPDDVEIALAMLNKGLDPNYVSVGGVGLLAMSLRNYQSPQLITALLKRGTDPRQLVDGQSAVEYVLRYEYSAAYLNPLLDAIGGN
jgi:hypothetical protein